jgi:site-specific recombinase XerD
MHVILYKRHKQTCDHKDEPTYKRCDCAVWFQTNIDGKQKRWTSKESSWEAAQRTARVLEQQYEDAALGRTPQPGAAKSVREAVALFLEAKAGEGLSPDTIYRHKYITALLLDFCNREGVLFIKDLNLTHLTAWQAQWTVKAPQARRSRQEKVKYCFESEMISKNPALKWKGVKIKLGDQNVRAFTEAEYEKILSGIDATTMTDANKRRIRVLMQLQRWSGLSLVDAVCLSKDELKQEGKGKKESFRVVTDRQKTGTLINNWIPAWLGQELLTVKNGNPEFFFWSGSTTPEDAPSYFQKLYRKVFKAAGVEGSSHDFRHTYAVELLKSGVDIRTVSKALGHSSVTITEKFYSRWCTGQQDNLDNTLRAALE